MKPLFAFLITLCFLLVPAGCMENAPVSPYGGPTPTPTPDPTVAATVSVVDIMEVFTYTEDNITATHGQSVKWDNTNTGHSLNIDMGSGSCLVSGQTSFPFTFTFNTPGTYHFHCGIHSSCGNGTCPNSSICVGMTGTITVN